MRPELVFVYNADSGLFNTLSDMAHKVFSPETYRCNLCALTYGTFGIREEWRAFLEGLDAGLEFLHRDELADRYGLSGIDLPAVFLKRDNRLDPLIGAGEIAACRELDELKLLIRRRLYAD